MIKKGAAYAEPERDWTVMVYMSGKNSLSPAAKKDLQKMEEVGSTDKVAFVVQYGTIENNEKADRYLVQRNPNPGSGQMSKPVESITCDMGAWTSFSNFAVWAMKKYPAKHYALVMWNHGYGWMDLWGSNKGAELAVSGNDLSMNEIRINELGMSLQRISARTGRKIDVLAFDACYMAMLEVLVEIKDYADFVVASEDVEPEDGYPYAKIFKGLVNNSSMEPMGFGALMVTSYREHYGKLSAASSGDRNYTLSVVMTSKISAVVSAINRWADAVMKVPLSDALRSEASLAKRKVLGFKGYDSMPDAGNHPMSVDLADYVTLLGKTPEFRAAGLAGQCSAVSEAIRNAVSASYSSTSMGVALDAGGIAVYLPARFYRPSYDDTKAARISRWDDFLKWTLTPSVRTK
ncbi:MAG: clostripain-related cysteine peptidase [Elusimicrobiaceae bacterium]